jgi:hypothetical protein
MPIRVLLINIAPTLAIAGRLFFLEANASPMCPVIAFSLLCLHGAVLSVFITRTPEETWSPR